MSYTRQTAAASIQNVLFMDIETVPDKDKKEEMLPHFLQRHGHEFLTAGPDDEWGNPVQETPQQKESRLFDERAGLHAEFGKICCVTMGKMTPEGIFAMATFCSDDESELLDAIGRNLINQQPAIIAAHNGLEFDFPFSMRRYMLNGKQVPSMLNSAGKKTWDLPQHDTMQMWGGSNWRYKISLDLLAKLFNIPSPKQEIKGSDIAPLFFSGNPDDRMKIKGYNQRDVVTCAKVYCAIRGFEVFSDDAIKYPSK